MFRLARFFAVTSLAVLIVAAVAIGWLLRSASINDLVEAERNKDIAITQSFANTIWPDFSAFLLATEGLEAGELAAHPNTAELRRVILAQMAGIDVVKVKIYDLDGLTVFSTQESQIGEDQSANPGFLAARNGDIITELTHSSEFNAFDRIIEDHDVLGTYLPIRRTDSDTIEGVFELYTDVTPHVDAIDARFRDIVLIVGALFATLYLALFGIVRFAESILHTQYQERLRAEENLRQRIETEQLVATISALLANSMPEEVDAGVDAALEQLGAAVGADYAVLYYFNAACTEIDRSFVWGRHRPGARAIAAPATPGEFTWLMGELANHQTLVIDDLATLPPAAGAEQRFFRSLDVRRVWICPILQDKNVVGFLGLLTAQPDWATPQQMFGLTAIIADIFCSALARQRVAADLLVTQRQLTHLISHSPVVIYSARAENPLFPTYVSDTVTQMLGFSPQAFLRTGSFWQERIHPDDRHLLLDAVAGREREGRWLVEYRVRRRDGDWRWLRDEARLVYDAAEQPAEVVGSWIDITATKHAEAILTQSEARFATLVQSMEDIVFTVDCRGRYSSIYGRASGEGRVLSDRIVGLSPHEVWDDDTADIHYASNLLALRGQTVVFEWSVQEDERGETTHFQTSLSPLHDEEGKVAGVVGVSRNISDLKRLEQVKTDFLANVSHELRTPLASILGYTETLLRGHPGSLTPVQQEFLQTVYDSGRRLKVLVDDLLDVSRLESGRFSLAVDDVDLNMLIRKALDTIRPLAAKSSIEVTASLPAVIPIIEGDPHRIGQVLDNLLSNAVKFSSPGGRVTLTVSEEARYLCLTFTDAGIGIPDADLPHLFSRFHRARNVSHDATGGAGLGLYITKAIVDGHGGRIDVESVLGQGTTFQVRFPYLQASPTETPPDVLVREMTQRYFPDAGPVPN